MELITSLHAVAGFVIALTGLAQIIFKKGGVYHAVIGFTYLSAWLIVVCTGGALGHPLITLFGVLGFYMAITGWRFANRRRSTPKTLEKIIYWIGLAAALYTLIWSILLVMNGSSFGWIALFFGTIFTLTTVMDVAEFIFKKKLRRNSGTRKQWYFEHLTRMYISYIAAMTAFAVINEVFFNQTVNWILPSVLGTILIIISRRVHAKKLALKEAKEKE